MCSPSELHMKNARSDSPKSTDTLSASVYKNEREFLLNIKYTLTEFLFS